MLTTEDAIRILNILSDVGWPSNAKKGYEITGYEVNDDGPEAPEGERYWGDVFVNGYSAGVATMVCFAIFDPVDLFSLVFPEHSVGRELGYTLGFFLFWMATMSSSLFTWYLLRPASRFNHPLKGD